MITQEISLHNKNIVDRLNTDEKFRKDVQDILYELVEYIAESINKYIDNPNYKYTVLIEDYHLYIKNNSSIEEWKELGEVFKDYDERIRELCEYARLNSTINIDRYEEFKRYKQKEKELDEANKTIKELNKTIKELKKKLKMKR